MRIAITGANGQLGQALVATLSSQHEIVALARSDVDLSAPAATQHIVATGAQLVIHPAAYTDVDGCARDPQRAYRVNCLGARAVALACVQLDAPLVHVSTNEVFSGAATRPYYEYDQTGPINAYGWSKWCGEQAVRELLRRFFIVRVAWLFGGQRNFVRTVLRLARERGALTMVADEVGSPTYAADVAQAIGALIAQPAYGTYHFVNSGHCSRYEFAHEILRQSGLAHVPLTGMLLADYKRDSTPPPSASRCAPGKKPSPPTCLASAADERRAALSLMLADLKTVFQICGHLHCRASALISGLSYNPTCATISPVIDIIIPNYNGAALLPACLNALRSQTRRDFAITVVDDGSADDSLALLARSYPEVGVLALERNRGFVAAVNAGFRATRQPFFVLLNNDAAPAPRWLEYLVGALERYPAYAFAASKLLLNDRRDHLHSAGDFYQLNGVPGSRGVWQRDTGQYDAVAAVFGPCAAAAAYRRAALAPLSDSGQLLDEDLVMYCEDVDLNLRAHYAGLRTIFEPRAVVYHRLSATGGGALASYYCGRNFPLVWLKNVPAPIQRRHWPQLLASQLGFALHSLWHAREHAARARLRGQLAALPQIPRFLRKRRARHAAQKAHHATIAARA